MATIKIKLAGRVYTGWETASITKSIENLAGVFNLTISNNNPLDISKWFFSVGDEIQILIDSEVILMGYLEDFNVSYDDTSHVITLAGRDYAGDLVDCCCIGNNEWIDASPEIIIRDICSPFDIGVVNNVGTLERLKHFKINEGETAFNAIGRLSRMRGFLVISYGDGYLTMARAGTASHITALKLGPGGNILDGDLEQSDRARFSRYIVKGQSQGGDLLSLLDYIETNAQKADAGIRRYRPLVILAETQGTTGALIERARWEAVTRAGASRKLKYTIQGWQQSNGTAWRINQLTYISDSLVGIEGTYLLTEITYSFTAEGALSQMSFADPAAYEILSEPEDIESSMIQQIRANLST